MKKLEILENVLYLGQTEQQGLIDFGPVDWDNSIENSLKFFFGDFDEYESEYIGIVFDKLYFYTYGDPLNPHRGKVVPRYDYCLKLKNGEEVLIYEIEED